MEEAETHQPIDTSTIVEILHSMGIDSYEPGLLLAINEYARRFTQELMHDCKDYANHSGRENVTVADVELAVKLSDCRTVGVDPKLHVATDVAHIINSQDLIQAIDHDHVLIHHPKKLNENLLQRTYTFVSGQDGFPEEYNEIHEATYPKTSYGMAPTDATTTRTFSGLPFSIRSEKRRRLEASSDFEGMN